MKDLDEGFTLVELLVSLVVIGILSAIAIPAYLQQRDRSYLASLQTDVRHTAVAVEGWTSQSGHQLSALNNADQNSPQLLAEGWHPSRGVELKILVSGADYCIEGRHDHVAGTAVRYRRSAGRIEVGPSGTMNC